MIGVTWVRGPELITRRPVVLSIAATLFGATGCSRERVEPLTRQALEDERSDAGAPALVAAAAKRGHAAKIWIAGERLAGSGIPVSAQDIWHLGSITKSMTATLVARLVELDAVRWDDTVGEVLKNIAPDMREIGRAHV